MVQFSGDSAHTDGEVGPSSSRRNSSSTYQRSEISCLGATLAWDGTPGDDKLRPGRTSVSQRISNDTAKERNSGQASEDPHFCLAGGGRSPSPASLQYVGNALVAIATRKWEH